MERNNINIQLGKFIATHRHTPFEYGQNDCNVFISKWVDTVKDTDITNTIVGNYNNVRGMLRFSKVKKIKKELEKAGYSQVKDSPTTGDILIRKDPAGFYHSAIVMHGFAYTMDKDKDLCKAHLHDIMLPGTEIWRTV